jgi:hypothetical protein
MRKESECFLGLSFFFKKRSHFWTENMNLDGAIEIGQKFILECI